MASRPYSDKVAEHASLMSGMMQRLGIEEADVSTIDGGLALWAAQTKCLFCPDLKSCKSWLVDGDATKQPNEFCPNHALFRSIHKPGEQ